MELSAREDGQGATCRCPRDRWFTSSPLCLLRLLEAMTQSLLDESRDQVFEGHALKGRLGLGLAEDFVGEINSSSHKSIFTA